MIKSLRPTSARTIAATLVSLALTLTTGLAPVAAGMSPVLSAASAPRTLALPGQATLADVAVEKPVPAAAPVTVNVTGTLTAFTVDPFNLKDESKTEYTLNLDDGTMLPLGEDLQTAALLSGVSVEAALAVPQRIVNDLSLVRQSELALALAKTNPESTLDGTNGVGKELVEMVAKSPEVPVFASWDAEPLAPAAASTDATGLHKFDIVFANAPGQDWRMPKEKLDEMMTTVEAFFKTETNGRISGFEWDYGKTASVIANTAREMCQEATSSAFLDKAAEAIQPGRSHLYYTTPGRETHLLLLRPIDQCVGLAGPIGLSAIAPIGIDNGGVIVQTSVHSGSTYFEERNAAVLAHEFGHNLGLKHSNLAMCPTPLHDGPFVAGSCGTYPYGDGLDLMGSAGLDMPLHPYGKARLGILEKGVGWEMLESRGHWVRTIKMLKMGVFDGLQEIRIRDPYTKHIEYSLDYRSPSIESVYKDGEWKDITEQAGVRLMRLFYDYDSAEDPLVQDLLSNWGRDTNRLTLPVGNGEYAARLKKGQSFISGTEDVKIKVLEVNGDEATLDIEIGPQEPQTLVVSESDLTLDSSGEGASTTIDVTTNAAKGWTATLDNSNWVTIDRTSGPAGTTSLRVTAAPNQYAVARQARITLTARDAETVTIDVKQEAVGLPEVSVSPATWNAPSAGETIEVKITTNQSWWSASSSANSWLKYAYESRTGDGKLQVIVEPNLGTTQRVGVITVDVYGASATLTVTQAASHSLSLSRGRWDPSAIAASVAVTVSTNQPLWNARSDQPWLTADRTSGADGMQVTVAVDVNESTSARVGHVAFTAGEATQTLTVTQAAAPPATLSLTRNSWGPSAKGNSMLMVVMTNRSSWNAESTEAWLTVGPPDGRRMTLTVAANPGTSQRTGTVAVTAGGLTETVKVTQAGRLDPPLSLSPTTWEPTADAQSTSLTLMTDQDRWMAWPSDSWLSLSKSQDVSGDVSVTVEANTAGSSRTGSILFYDGEATVAFTVTQAGTSPLTPTVSLAASMLAAPAFGSTVSTSVTTNQASWNAVVTSGTNWLTMGKASGSSGGEVSVIVSPNTSTASRQGTVTVTAGTATVTLTITQAATPVVILSKATWEPTSGAQYEQVTVTTNQERWTASSNQSWLTVYPGNGISGEKPYISVSTKAGPEPRTGTVTFNAGSATATFTVTQAGVTGTAELWLSQTDWDPTAPTQRLAVTVSTNQSGWAAVSNQPSWLTVSPSGGGDGSKANLEVTANLANIARTGVITFTAGGVTENLTVIQAGNRSPTLSVDGANWHLGSYESTVSLYVRTTEPSWSATADSPWITVLKGSGVSGEAAQLLVAENPNSVPRDGYVTITAGAATARVKISQALKAVTTLSRTVWNPTATAQSTKVTVTTNDTNWRCVPYATWLKVDPSQGETGGVMNVYVEANTSALTRTAQVICNGASSADPSLTVTQAAGVAPELSLSMSSIEADSSGRSDYLTVTTNLPSWSAVSNQPWLTLNRSNGVEGVTDRVRVTAAENPSQEPRTGTITFTASGYTATLTVTQLGAAWVKLSETNWTPSYAGESITLTVTSNRPWIAEPSNRNLTVNPTSGNNGDKITITVTANPTPVVRYGSVSLVASSNPELLQDHLRIEQAASPAVDLSETTWLPSQSGQSKGINVTTNQPQWNAAVTSGINWLTVDSTSGASGTTTTVSVAPNTTNAPRTGTIVFTADAATVTLTVTQTGTPIVDLGQTTWEPTYRQQAIDIRVTSYPSKWTATSSGSDWLWAYANGIDMVQVMAAANQSNSPRTGVITITAGGATATITVTQAGVPKPPDPPSLSLSNDYWLFNGQANSFAVTVATNQPGWSAVASVPWLTVSPGIGVPGGVLTVNVSANTSGAARSGTVTVAAGGLVTSLTVEQNPTATASLTLSRTSTYAAPNAGSSVSVTATTNQVRWNAVSSVSWVSVTPAFGASKDSFLVTAEANPTNSSRRGTVSVTAGSVTRSFTVSQTAGSLTASPSGTWAAPVAGGARSVTVTTSVPAGWRASSNATWVTVSPPVGVSGQSFTIQAAGNDGPARVATVTVVAAGLTRTVSITQAAATFTVSPASYTATAGGSSRTITINTSVPSGWRLTGNTGESWVSLSTDQGSGSAGVTLLAAANPTTAARSAILELHAGQLARFVTVTQSGSAWITPEVTSWTPSTSASQTTIPVTTNQPVWTATSNASWVTVTTTGQDVTLSVGATTRSRRTATVTLRAGSASKTISITQSR